MTIRCVAVGEECTPALLTLRRVGAMEEEEVGLSGDSAGDEHEAV